MYLPTWIWKRIMDPEVHSMTVLDHITTHLCQMGLKTPSELTQAVFVAVLTLREPKQRQSVDSQSLRTMYLNTKSQLQSKLAKLKVQQHCGAHPLFFYRPIQVRLRRRSSYKLFRRMASRWHAGSP